MQKDPSLVSEEVEQQRGEGKEQTYGAALSSLPEAEDGAVETENSPENITCWNLIEKVGTVVAEFGSGEKWPRVRSGKERLMLCVSPRQLADSGAEKRAEKRGHEKGGQRDICCC